MNRMVSAIALLAAVLVASLLAWRAGEQARLVRAAEAEREAAVRAAKDLERLNQEATGRPGEPLIERLRVEPAVIDFGELLPDVVTSRPVRLHNIGDRPIRVLRAVADCSCTTPSVPMDPIPPGASVDADIMVRAGNTQGTRLVKRVTYEVEGALPAFCTVEGDVRSYIRCTPTTLQAPASGVDAPSGEIALESALDIPFSVTEVDPAIEADGPVEFAVRQTLRIDWRAWREAGRPLQVTITTDHAGAPPITVVIRRSEEP